MTTSSIADAAEAILEWISSSNPGLARVQYQSEATQEATWALVKAGSANATDIRLPLNLAPTSLGAYEIGRAHV